MPRAAKKQPTIDKTAVYVCWMSGSADVDGVTYSFHQGQRLRGDDPTVQAVPHYWVPDGTPESERPNFWDAVIERRDAERPPPDFAVTLSGALPVPLEVEDTVRLLRAVRVRAGYVDDQRVVQYERDTILPASCELVSLLPDDSYEHTTVQFTRAAKGRRR